MRQVTDEQRAQLRAAHAIARTAHEAKRDAFRAKYPSSADGEEPEAIMARLRMVAYPIMRAASETKRAAAEERLEKALSRLRDYSAGARAAVEPCPAPAAYIVPVIPVSAPEVAMPQPQVTKMAAPLSIPLLDMITNLRSDSHLPIEPLRGGWLSRSPKTQTCDQG